MYSGNRRKESLETFLRSGGIVLAAFAVTLVIFLLFQQFMQNTRGRFSTLMREAGVDDQRTAHPSTGQTVGYSPLSPTMPRITAGYIPPGSNFNSYTPALPPPTNAYAPTDIFTTNEERDQAQAALESLRTTIQIVRQYDSSSFWQELPKADVTAANTDANNPNQATPLGAVGEGEGADEPQTRLYATVPDGAAARRQKMVARISNEAEALHTELSLVGNPDLFPEQVRNLAKIVALEARVYLSTVQLALVRADQRSEMQALAREHLRQSEAALRELERVTGYRPGQGGSGGLAN